MGIKKMNKEELMKEVENLLSKISTEDQENYVSEAKRMSIIEDQVLEILAKEEFSAIPMAVLSKLIIYGAKEGGYSKEKLLKKMSLLWDLMEKMGE